MRPDSDSDALSWDGSADEARPVFPPAPADGDAGRGHPGRRAGREYPRSPRDHSDPPVEGYLSLTVPNILDRLGQLPLDQVRAVREYERSHRRRKTLLVRLERLLRDHEPAR